MKRSMPEPALLMILALITCCGAARAAGVEDFGNAPLNAADFTDWPGIMPVLNHPGRVYHCWREGDEEFYYRGQVAALNDALAKFGAAGSPGREVVLRPGPGVTHSFDGKQIKFGWDLHLIGGFVRHEATLHLGDQVWPTHPVLSVYVGGPMALEKIRFPAGVTVRSVTEVKRRTRAALKSRDQTVRGWASQALAALDPYDPESRDVIAGLLKDKESWVRENALHALAEFGRKAQPALPLLRAALETGDADLKAQAEKTIQAIEAAPDTTAAERAHRERLEKIERLLAVRNGWRIAEGPASSAPGRR